MKIRLDILLVKQGLATNRSKAKRLLERGLVIYQSQVVTKPSTLLEESSKLTLKDSQTFVSRGALKLKTALEHFQINPKDKIIADIGASTGGFTDLLLQKGAKKAYCVDVGVNQIDPKLLNDPRVENYEGINVKTPFNLPEQVDLVVVDLSFISLRLTLLNIIAIAKQNANIILLFKPQFEAGPNQVGKDGVLKDPEQNKKILQDFIQWLKGHQLTVLGHTPSQIKGKKGNQEHLILLGLQSKQSDSSVDK